MSDMINASRGKNAMMYVGDVPWHGKGVQCKELQTAEDCIVKAEMDFKVEKRPLLAIIDAKTNHFVSVPRKFATVRLDTNEVLGTVGAKYHVIQNVDAFKFFDSLVGKGEAIYETAGVLGNGERIWILAKLPGYIKVGGKDIVNKYLLLTNTHDGSSVVRAKLTPIRVVCNNTLSVALRGSEQEVRVRHGQSAEEKLEEAHKILGLSNALYKDLEEIFKRMSLVNLTGNQLVDYVKTLVPDNEDAERNTRTENIRDKIIDLHDNGQGSQLARGTLWGAYNSVTEYVDHVYNTTQVDKKLQSMWFGSGAKLKEKAFEVAKEMLN